MQLGVIGLGTMGANLARNAAHCGVEVSVFNRTQEKTDAFMRDHGGEGVFVACKSHKELVDSLQKPRAILLMVKAGDAVDTLIEDLLSLVDPGDMLIDAGNSHFADTDRRDKHCSEKGVLFVGMGVSGGEEGALKGPSMMPAGDRGAVDSLMPMLLSMAADDGDGGKCVANIGTGGSGHFVKMVHNGIEYAVMQVLAECYHLWKAAGLSHAQMHEEVAAWNSDPFLTSFLLDITEKIFALSDPETGKDMLDVILDQSGQKGTGKWTVQTALDLGVAVPMIAVAVDARIASAAKEFRVQRSKEAPVALLQERLDGASLLPMVRDAYLLGVLSAYSEGFLLLSVASKECAWNLQLSEIARIWRGGCIIRSGMLPAYQAMFGGDKKAQTDLRSRFAGNTQKHLRECVALGVSSGIPVPALAAALSSYDSYRSAWLPQNLTNAQRDFFGAHGFARVDKAGEFHLPHQA